MGGDQYGILINKSLDMESMKEGMTKITASLYAGFKEAKLPTSAFVHCWPEEDAIKNKNNILPSLPEHLVDFIDSVPTVEIEPSDVSSLDVKDYDAEIDRFTELVNKLMQDNDKMTDMMVQQQKDFQAQLSEQQKRFDQRAAEQQRAAEKRQ